jgi:quercetin dioxygenase-like cupin family protein
MQDERGIPSTDPAPGAPNIIVDAQRFETFHPEKRSGVRLYTSDQCDVLMVCWEPGQVSSFHDHGPSESIVHVLRGVLEVRGDGIDPTRLTTGQVVITPVGTRHQLANPGPDQLVTLHFYSPRMQTPMSGPITDCRAAIYPQTAAGVR